MKKLLLLVLFVATIGAMEWTFYSFASAQPASLFLDALSKDPFCSE